VLVRDDDPHAMLLIRDQLHRREDRRPTATTRLGNFFAVRVTRPPHRHRNGSALR
jgi:hypothetical protein